MVRCCAYGEEPATEALPFELAEVLSRLDGTFEAESVNEIERAGRPLVVLVLLIRPEDELSESVSVHTARLSVRTTLGDAIKQLIAHAADQPWRAASRMLEQGSNQYDPFPASTRVPVRILSDPVEAQGLDLPSVDPRNRELPVATLLDVHAGVDPEDVLVPHGLGHRRVPGDDRMHPLDRPQVLISGFPDLALNVSVTNSAPKGSRTCDVAPVPVSVYPLLEVLPARVNGGGMDEPDPP